MNCKTWFLIFSRKGLKKPWFLQISWQSHHINLVHHILTFPLKKCQHIKIDFFPPGVFLILVFTLHQNNKKWWDLIVNKKNSLTSVSCLNSSCAFLNYNVVAVKQRERESWVLSTSVLCRKNVGTRKAPSHVIWTAVACSSSTPSAGLSH